MSPAHPPDQGKVVSLFDGNDLQKVAARLKKIAAASYDHLLLADGPPQPDYELLDLCGDALHYAKAANLAWESRVGPPKYGSPDDAAWRARDHALLAEYSGSNHQVTQRLRRAKKMRATTPAGIYAKALLVRCSKTGAAELAMSLAIDLVECQGLRDTLWPAERVSA